MPTNRWRSPKKPSAPIRLPLYPFKFVIPVAGFFLLLQGLIEIVRCVICLRDGAWPSRVADVVEVDVDKLKEMVHVKDEDIAQLDQYVVRAGGEAMKKELRFGFALMAIILAAIAFFMPWGNLSNGHLGLLMLALVVVAIMLGFPTAFTLMGMGMIFAWFAYRSSSPDLAVQQTLDLMVQRAYGVMTNDVLISIPLFVFMGYLVERANLIEKLFKSLHLALARIPGSLAVATLVTCAIFATATGIVGAVVTLMGLLALPAMLRAGYNVKLSAGVITAGGCLGILIPPSVLLIVYGATAGVSVVKLYAGAFFPGLMLALLYVGYVILMAKLKPEWAPPLPESERKVDLPAHSARVAARFGNRALPALFRAMLTRGRCQCAEGPPHARTLHRAAAGHGVRPHHGAGLEQPHPARQRDRHLDLAGDGPSQRRRDGSLRPERAASRWRAGTPARADGGRRAGAAYRTHG